MKFSHLSIFLCLELISYSTEAQPSHATYSLLLKEFVNDEGWVDYVGLGQNRDKLDNYLYILRNNHPEDTWSKEEQIAYWINAYNAFTLQLILDNYPIESIKDIGSWLQIPFVNTPWDIEFIEIEGRKYDLNNIEHDILRGEFEEPRIHFAIVCASYSCPKLGRNAYIAETLDQQLEAAAIDFINDKQKNQIAPNSVSVSKIFSWFGSDFKKQTTLREFLNKYSKVRISKDADIGFLEYNWNLNDQAVLR
ncbi:MAG: DUF547 domain-containing protein [Bacteroidetes bacterium]|nr:DUF547 domain-containing protein [Bacteroidota bacterium]MDA1120068.1 DUF547 domain-containing protein [Bacteroidota bacterium]